MVDVQLGLGQAGDEGGQDEDADGSDEVLIAAARPRPAPLPNSHRQPAACRAASMLSWSVSPAFLPLTKTVGRAR